jgi:hypothetical protein
MHTEKYPELGFLLKNSILDTIAFFAITRIDEFFFTVAHFILKIVKS